MSDLKSLQQQALAIRQRYNELNQKDGHGQWGPKDYALGFVGDVGQLARIVMAKESMRNMDDVDAKLTHELGDCLWSLLVLASHYDIDLGTSFQQTMEELDTRIRKAMA
jgi:NTP pyrophosphatase (non-canonical NTP hydrolase)